MLTLKAGLSSLVVTPEHGAAMTGWLLGATRILRRAQPGAAIEGNPHLMACFPLIPYCNRIANAYFTRNGVPYSLTRNFGDNPHTIHGIAWQRPWTVTNATRSLTTMNLDHHANDDWPFSFQAQLTYDLTVTGLTVTIALTNQHGTDAPAGIGLHPYFPKANNATLRFNATGVWQNGPDVLPASHSEIPVEWQHDTGIAVDQTRLDNCFTGWDRTAIINAGPASLTISASKAFHNLQVFTPHWGDFFCAEPVSHIPNALNRAGLPPGQAMHILKPDETLKGTITFHLG